MSFLIPIIVLCVAILVAVAMLMMNRKNIYRYNTNEAEAVVLSISQTGLYVNDLPQWKLQVQVLPDNGRNFVAEVFLAQEIKIVSGLKIRVSYNPVNHRDVKLVSAA